MNRLHDEGSTKGRPRLLLVDDEVCILRSLERLLRGDDYDVVVANSGEEALAVMAGGGIDLVISDQRMPGMTGTDLLGEVRRRWPQTIRIILSGYSEVKTILGAVNEGEVYKYMTKPWNDEELKLNVRRAIEQHALQAENVRMADRIEQQNAQLRQLNRIVRQHVRDAGEGLAYVQKLLEMIDAMPDELNPTDPESIAAADSHATAASALRAKLCNGVDHDQCVRVRAV